VNPTSLLTTLSLLKEILEEDEEMPSTAKNIPRKRDSTKKNGTNLLPFLFISLT